MIQPSTPLSIQELTFKIKQLLETQLINIQVIGEISNLKHHSSGHLYFDLKDAHAKISAVMFKRQSDTLQRLPKEGDKIIVSASINVYPPHGKYQLIINSLEYQGVGDLLLKFEELKNKLKARGWCDQENKKPLPVLPKTIGVVTSPTGAVIRDIIHVLTRRHSGFHLILNPVRVQGEGAALEIATAIQEFNQYQLVDVIIVGRGGGSLEDLWAFNEEITAEAIFYSKIPIISAVGHETDFTLADFVADVRAPTPSAAAEIVTAEKSEKLASLSKSKKLIDAHIRQLLRRYKERLATLKRQPVLVNPMVLLSGSIQKLDELKEELAFSVKRKLSLIRERLSYKEKQLLSINPKNVLKRGYAILFAEKEKSVIVSSKSLQSEQIVSALLSEGTATLKVLNYDE
jgi:exodeoxyribonuclease VII large subunit